MSVYLDASVAMSLFMNDAHTVRADRWFATGPRVTTSAWMATEFSSALSLAIRTGRAPREQQASLEARFDSLLKNIGPLLPVEFEDFSTARRLIRRHPLLRAGDALHLAVAKREDLAMATFDVRLADVAQLEGVAVADV